MRLELEVDDDQVGFFLELIGYFDFIELAESDGEQRKIPTSIQRGRNPLDEATRGEIKLQMGHDFLDEMERE
jgi:hypothetical protein